MPIEKNGRYIFSSGDLAIEIDPRVGGRVVSLSLGGRNFLTGTDVDPNNYGSTFWTSPQSDWGWPPPPEIDNLPYASAIAGTKLVLTGSTNAKLGVSVTKTFSFDAATSSLAIEYARQRHAFGKPLTQHQVIGHKLVDMAQRVAASQAMLEMLAWRLDRSENPVAEICMLKNQATQTMAFCASEAVQIFGGAGFMRGIKVERIYREVKVNAIGGGTEEIMKDLASRQMGL